VHEPKKGGLAGSGGPEDPGEGARLQGEGQAAKHGDGRLTLASAGSPSAAPRLAWAASLVALAVLLLALHAFRAEIAAAWPPMLRLYRALGLL
jgi:hypothetical protein